MLASCFIENRINETFNKILDFSINALIRVPEHGETCEKNIFTYTHVATYCHLHLYWKVPSRI